MEKFYFIILILKKLTFNNIKTLITLITYLKDEHKGKYHSFEIFPDGKCRPSILSVNSDDMLQQKI